MQKIVGVLLLLMMTKFSFGQSEKKIFKGMYIQWGYNREWYTKSNIHIKLSNGSDFIMHNVVASDKPNFESVFQYPGDISIPQYNYRIGFYLNRNKTKAVELNFDHAKYVVDDYQKVHVTGVIEGNPVNGDSILNPVNNLHLEHTDGANWVHINYVQQKTILSTQSNKRPIVNLIGKIGAGINIPRTDFTWRNDRFNNNFHIAGYNISIEGGARYYFAKRWFLEATAKTGYVRYVNALANTTELKNNRVKHDFEYFEIIGLIGFDIPFK
jgi:hypothetical protein